MSKTKRSLIFVAAGAAGVTFLVFLKTLQNGFVNWDDNAYVYDNLLIRSHGTDFLKWAFTDLHTTSNWHPLTWMSHALDYAIWGLNPLGHHLTSIILHAANTFLVVLLAAGLLESVGQPSGSQVVGRAVNDSTTRLIAAMATGLLFGLHPVHVESVAWVSERKDLLCALFYLLSVMAYMKYAGNIVLSFPLAGDLSEKCVNTGKDCGQAAMTKPGRRSLAGAYLLSLCFFVLALLSKPMAVSLPVVLLILDWYPVGRVNSSAMLKQVFAEKIPFFAASIAAATVAVYAHSSEETLVRLHDSPLAERLLVAAHSLVFYLWKLVIPLNLSPFYPYPRDVSILSPNYYLPFAAVVVITLFCLYRAGKERVWLAVWMIFVVLLLPVIGIVRTGEQAAADRYTYLAGIGPFLIAGSAATWAWRKYAPSRPGLAVKTAAAAAFCGVFLSLSYLTMVQTGVWKDSLTLWNYVIEKNPGVYFAYNNRGVVYEETGRYDKAIEDYNTSIALDPGFFRAYVNRGILYSKKGMYEAAIRDFDKVIALKPDFGEAYAYRGVAYDKEGLFERAAEDFRKAVAKDPGSYRTYINIGVAYEGRALFDEALDSYNRALTINPGSVTAYYNRGGIYYKKGLYGEAISDYTSAISLDPDFKKAYYSRAAAYMRTGRADKAEEDFRNFRGK